jgi:hypothetical protein
MKTLKIFAWIVITGIALVVIALALSFTPAVQTWAVRKAVADMPGTKIQIGRIAAGWSHATASDVRVEKDGAVITVASFAATYSAWDYIAHHRINVDDAVARDVVIDLRTTPPAAASSVARTASTGNPPNATNSSRPASSPTAPGTRSQFDGLLREAQLPFDVRIAHLAANGRALLAADRTATFEVSGSDIANGQRGRLEWKADFSDAAKTAAVSALQASGVVTLHLTADRRIDALDANATAAARGEKIPSDRLELTARAAQTAANGAETYSLALDLAGSANKARVLAADAAYDPTRHEISGTWRLAAQREQLAALLAGLGLPDVAAEGSGKFSLQPTTANVAASGELRANVSRLEKISAELGAVGAVQVHATFDGGLADNTARLERLQLEATGANGQKFAQVDLHQRVAFSLADQRVTLADPKAELARLSLQNLPLSWAQAFVQPLVIERGDVSLVLAIAAEADGSEIRARPIEPLLVRNVILRSGDRRLVDQLTLAARPQVDYRADKIAAQLADLKISLPAGDNLGGTIDADITRNGAKSIVAFAAQLQGRVVAALKPYLPLDPGPLGLTTALNGHLDGSSLQLEKASVNVSRDGGAALAALDLQQRVTVDLAEKTFAVPNAAASLARVHLGEIPLAWAEAFVPKSKFAGTLAGATLEVGARSLDELTVNTTEPLALRGAGATLDGQPLAQALDATVEFSATKRRDAIAYNVRRFEVKQGSASFLSFTAAGNASLGAKLNATAKGNLSLDAAALSNQPASAQFATLARGKITADFDATLADTIHVAANVAAKGLVARANNQPLGDLEFKLDADVKADGTGKIAAPLTLTNGTRRSDLTIDGTLGRTANEFSFNGKLGSTQLIVDDFQALAALAPSSPTAAPNATAAPRSAGANPAANSPAAADATAKPDMKPFWQGVAGHIDVDLKKIQYGRDYVVSNVTGGATISATKLALENLGGKMKDNAFKLTGAVTFAANQPQPYTLAGSADVGGLDLGAILRAANPDEKPALETTLAITAKVDGRGANLATLAQNVYGQFDVKGGKGTLRALGNKGEKIGTVSSIVGLIGQARGSDTTVAVGELGRELEEMPFDTLTLHAERAADLSMKITNVEFLSAATRVTATGTVAHQPGVALTDLPFQFDVKLAGKEHMAQLLNRIGALSGTQDDKGYYPMAVSFPVNGTLNKVNNGLWKILAQTAARAALGGFLR